MNDEPATKTIRSACRWIGHVHLSEPQLAKLGLSEDRHVAIAEALRECNPARIVTLEMKTAGLEALDRAIRFAKRMYV